jgi:hypothetical protein
MLDGRIDAQGTPKQLRARGILEDITHDSAVQVKEEEAAAAPAPTDPEVAAAEGDPEAKSAAKAARKLVKDEHRETGGVKWSIYKTYLKASCYWSWVILLILVVLQQVCAHNVWLVGWLLI